MKHLFTRKLDYSLWSIYKNWKNAFVKKEKNEGKSQKVSFQKSRKLLPENRHERPTIQNIQ